jgi:2-polyprenyl-3-methyl-5-hydroxy-6-metoxy-1,4-benzoquinol methylase
MQQTPIHEYHNPDLLRLIPVQSKKIVEIGCSSGALAREFKKIAPDCFWLGVEIDSTYAEMAKRYCDKSIVLDIETAPESFWEEVKNSDCWIFGDTLEHLRDPWKILRLIRANISNTGSVVACIPNAQHWSLQARLNIGDFRYEEAGLLDKTHLRWFTRQTIIEMFDQTGFRIEAGAPRIFEDPNREVYLPIIEQMARASGADPQITVNDSLPWQYVVQAVPV